jgi:hypothetical protein
MHYAYEVHVCVCDEFDTQTWSSSKRSPDMTLSVHISSLTFRKVAAFIDFIEDLESGKYL